jgi:serine/threonine-protein kinase
MPTCPSCQIDVPEGKRFCADCGAALHITSAPTETSQGRLHSNAPRHAAGGQPGDARFIPGSTVAGRYRIVGLLGRGGMGEVYRADDLKLGQPVALKFLPSSLNPGDRRFDRLLSEVRLARQVSHPNVCRVYDAGEVEGQHFLSMEYIDGEDLASLLRRIGRLPKDKAIELARQLCAGLNAAHEQGILHRDLKPANVMIDGRGRAKITDFGLAALSHDLGGEDPSAGTPAYMAPEQLAGREVTVRSDLYALGLVLYELFTGRLPFSSRSVDEIVRQRSRAGISSPSDHVEGFDPAVERAIARCLENEPKDRPASALAVSAALPGGDPLAAALAGGETPSPEMVAAAGESEALSPLKAIALATLAVGLFVSGAMLNGRITLRGWLPLDKPPAVMIDRARVIIDELGYTEPVYAEPADEAYGYSIRQGPLDDIRINDKSPDRWERLRDPRAGVLSFWYRQSPRPLRPRTEQGGPGMVGRVERWNPFPRTTGEVLVSLGPDGRLETFVAKPRRFAEPPADRPEYDWSLPFRLAGLDMADFEQVEPRYQRYMQNDLRAAWAPRDPDEQYRIEAGVNEGRLTLFVRLTDDQAKRLAAEPEEFGGRDIPDVFGWFILSIAFASAFVARANIRRGRADRRGAFLLGLIMGSMMFLADLLAVHAVVGGPGFGLSLMRGISWGTLTMVIYMALEPYARATWPSLLVSWNRLVGRPGPGGRDPGIGRALLAGLVAGGVSELVTYASWQFMYTLEDMSGEPGYGSWENLLSQREAWGGIVRAMSWSLNNALVIAFILVIARRMVRRRAPAAIVALVIQMVPVFIYATWFSEDFATAELVGIMIEFTISYTALILVVLNWGLVGAVALRLAAILVTNGDAVDWSAWHAQPAILATIAVSALAIYACWAATPATRRVQ